ncbi:hypothetical protein [Nocardia sp. CDC160]|nr:hypothetical protein [Nocardia sp. CDC160]MEC3914350.1 hypothetical protein [Nocardia sp. CDC160]
MSMWSGPITAVGQIWMDGIHHPMLASVVLLFALIAGGLAVASLWVPRR